MPYQLLKDDITGKLYSKSEDGSIKEIVPMEELFMPIQSPTPSLVVGTIVLYSNYKDMKFCTGLYSDCVGEITNIKGSTYTLKLYGRYNVNTFVPTFGTKEIIFNGNSLQETMKILSPEDLQELLPYNKTQKKILKEYVPATYLDLSVSEQTKESIGKKYSIILEDGNVVNLRDIYVNELYKFIENPLSVDNSWIRYTDKYVNFLTKNGNYLPLVLAK